MNFQFLPNLKVLISDVLESQKRRLELLLATTIQPRFYCLRYFAILAAQETLSNKLKATSSAYVYLFLLLASNIVHLCQRRS